MNIVEKAWNNVKSLAETSDYYKECDDKDIRLIDELVNVNNMHKDKLIEVFGKEMPEKPIYKRDRNIYVCSNCGVRFPYTRDRIDQCMYHYCPYCGQAIDWGTENV